MNKEVMPFGGVLRLEHAIQKGGDTPIDLSRDVPATISILQRGVGGIVRLYEHMSQAGDELVEVKSSELAGFDILSWLSKEERSTLVARALKSDEPDNANPLARFPDESEAEWYKRLLEALL